MKEIQVDKIVMPNNLKAVLMVAKQRKKCASSSCSQEFYGLGFTKSLFHVSPLMVRSTNDLKEWVKFIKTK